jgi:hypothetical protein
VLVEAPLEIAAGPEEVVTHAFTLRAGESVVRGKRDVVLAVESLDDPSLRLQHTTRFFGPER